MRAVKFKFSKPEVTWKCVFCSLKFAKTFLFLKEQIPKIKFYIQFVFALVKGRTHLFGGVSLHVEIIKYQRIHSPPWRRLNKPFLTKFAPKMKRNWRWGPNKIRHNLLSAQLVLSYSPLPYCPLLRRQSVHVSLCLCLFCVPKLDVFLLFLFQNSPPP